MKAIWNSDKLKNKYKVEYERAKRDKFNFTEDELSSPYLDKLSHQTNSIRILRMITLAYYLGKLRMIEEIDNGKSLVTMSNNEIDYDL